MVYSARGSRRADFLENDGLSEKGAREAPQFTASVPAFPTAQSCPSFSSFASVFDQGQPQRICSRTRFQPVFPATCADLPLRTSRRFHHQPARLARRPLKQL